MERPANYLTLEDVISRIDEGDDNPCDDMVMAQIIDIATDFREVIRAEEKATKKKKEYFKVMELAIIRAMKKAGTDDSPLLVAGGLQSTATFTTQDTPTVEDWDAVNKWVVENDGFHLYQKRISAKVWADEIILGDAIPGIKAFKVEKIGLRKR